MILTPVTYLMTKESASGEVLAELLPSVYCADATVWRTQI